MTDDELREFMREVRASHVDISKTHVDISNTLGKLEQGQESLNQYIGAVSSNTKEVKQALDSHKDDIDAHGVKTLRRVFAGIATCITVVVAILEGMHHVKK